jgi:hypothetical protein
VASETEFERLQRAFLAADRAGDVDAAKMLAQSIQQAQQQMDATHSVSGSAGTYKPESEAFKSGRAMPEMERRALKYADALLFGLPKKLLGAEGEQTVRGAMEEFKQTNPYESTAASFLGPMAPAFATGGATLFEPAAARATSAVAGPVVTAGRAAMQAAPQGALSAVGESESRDPVELAKAAAAGGALAGVMGGTTSGIGQGGIGIVRNMAARTTERGALSDAQRELAKALQRDMPYNSVFDRAGSLSTPAGRGMARLDKLGPEARLIDVGGANTRSLGDVLATLPGRAKQGFERAITERQTKRADRLMTAADEALGTSGKQYAPTIEALVQERSAAAGPLYQQLQGVQVQIDNDLFGLLRRAGKEAMGKSQRLARLAGEDQLALTNALQETRDAVTNATVSGKPIPFTSLDHVKQSLYDLERAYAAKGEKGEAAAFGNLRRDLTAKLDQMSPKDAAGNSIYAQAREAYAGPSQIADAVEAGRGALSEKAPELAALIGSLSQSEQEGFRVGILQALREKTGTEAGQTSLLKMWKEPGTSDKLRLLFGDDYRRFAAAVAKERNLKSMEQVGRGSQTAGRLAAAEDLGGELASGAADVAAATQTGNVVGGLSGIGKVRKAIALPESTRNQLAQMLLQRGGDAQATLKTLDQVIRNMNIKRARGTALAGALGAQGQRTLFPQQ